MVPTYDQIQLVKASWRPFRRIDPKLVGDVFYSKLFMDNPSLKKLFSKNIEEQYQKLFDMVNIIIARLDDLEKLEKDMAMLATRHHQYGVKEHHYKAVGNALLWTVKQGLGNDWQPAVADAWVVCYGQLSAMLIGASAFKVAQ